MFYGPGSDGQWGKLLQSIRPGTDYPNALTILYAARMVLLVPKPRALFKPHIRSDIAILNGLTLEKVRHV